MLIIIIILAITIIVLIIIPCIIDIDTAIFHARCHVSNIRLRSLFPFTRAHLVSPNNSLFLVRVSICRHFCALPMVTLSLASRFPSFGLLSVRECIHNMWVHLHDPLKSDETRWMIAR